PARRPPAGPAGPPACADQHATGPLVTLPATPASGWVFDGWGGACSGTGACAVTMSAARAVSAAFRPQQPVTLALSIDGNGTVVSSPPGIDCPGACSVVLPKGTTVVLTATPAPGWKLKDWDAPCKEYDDDGPTCTIVV